MTDPLNLLSTRKEVFLYRAILNTINASWLLWSRILQVSNKKWGVLKNIAQKLTAYPSECNKITSGKISQISSQTNTNSYLHSTDRVKRWLL